MSIPSLKYSLFIFIFLMSCCGWSQNNLVPNSSFEEYSSLPEDFGDWYKCMYWSSVNDVVPNTSPYASPDYFHTNAIGTMGLPNSALGTVMPHTGDAIMGIVGLVLTGNPDYREYVSVQLTSPMVPGTTYTVSFWLTNGSANQGGGVACNHIGVHFSTGPLTQAEHEPIAVIPQLEIPGEVWNTDWQQFTFTYTATAPYTHFTIGNFAGDSQVLSTVHIGYSQLSYYFIDDIEVVDSSPPPTVPDPVDTLCQGAACISVLEMPNVFTPDEDGTNDHFVPVTLENIKHAQMTIFNRWGELMLETDKITTGWDGQFNGKPCAEGVYFWTVNYEGENGQSYTIHGYVTVIR